MHKLFSSHAQGHVNLPNSFPPLTPHGHISCTPSSGDQQPTQPRSAGQFCMGKICLLHAISPPQAALIVDLPLAWHGLGEVGYENVMQSIQASEKLLYPLMTSGFAKCQRLQSPSWCRTSRNNFLLCSCPPALVPPWSLLTLLCLPCLFPTAAKMDVSMHMPRLALTLSCPP